MAARPAAALLLIGAALAGAGCLRPDGSRGIPLPVPGRELATPDLERERGFAFDREAKKVLPLVTDLSVLEFVDELGQDLVERLGEQPFDYRFRVIVDPALNAFAVPGGWVYLHTGTLLAAGSVEELSGVLAHELGHVKGHHSARMAKEAAIPSLLAMAAGVAASAATRDPTPIVAAQAANVAIQLQYSRQYEDEADRMAAVFLSRAGMSTEGMVRFFERIQLEQGERPQGYVPPYLFSHPQVEARIAALRALGPRSRSLAHPPDLDQRFAAMQARLAWLVGNRRAAQGAVEPYDRGATDALLAEAARAGRPDDALDALARAERAEPRDPRVPYRRAEILEAEGRLDDAIAAYRRAVFLDPNPPAVLLALARAHRAAGHRREALFFLDQAGWRAGATGRARVQIDAEIERTVFPVVAESGFADGSSGDGAPTPGGVERTRLAAGDRRAAWWARLSPHWVPSRGWFRVRWVDPAGRADDAESPERSGAHLVAARAFEAGGPAPGEWRVELLYGEEVVHSERIAAGQAR
jgi:predicted Zn-dependent protease